MTLSSTSCTQTRPCDFDSFATEFSRIKKYTVPARSGVFFCAHSAVRPAREFGWADRRQPRASPLLHERGRRRGAGLYAAAHFRCRTGPFIYESFRFWNAIPWSLHFLSVPDGKKTKQKKGQPPRHSGLKISPVTTLRATRSLRSLRQALRLTPPAKFSPFGHRPPFKGAGSCTSTVPVINMDTHLHCLCRRIFCEDVMPLHQKFFLGSTGTG